MDQKTYIGGIPETVMRLPWVERAMDPGSPVTHLNESMRTSSYEHEGQQILVPTIRQGEDGRLY